MKVSDIKVSQYHIWYNGMIIESTGYFPTVAAAKKFVAQRYGKNPALEIQPCYPVKHDVKFKVA